MLSMAPTGWYWTRENELRACIVLEVWDEITVLDAETLEPVDVSPADVMVEKPDE